MQKFIIERDSTDTGNLKSYGLTATRAATVQLSVPVIAAFGGVILLSEEITLRLLLASAATLGSIAIVLAQRTAKVQRP